jgi:tetratricopeptide (TPR) repeat protein
VDKQSFIKLVNNYTNTSGKDSAALAAIQKKYPYSQLIHTLVSRSVNDQNISGAEKFIQHAAIYAADRGILKDVLSGNIIPEKKLPQTSVTKTVEPVNLLNPTIVITDEEVAALSSSELRKDLKKNLGTLARLMKQFEKEFPQAISVGLPAPEVSMKSSSKIKPVSISIKEDTEKQETISEKKGIKKQAKKAIPKKRTAKKVATPKKKKAVATKNLTKKSSDKTIKKIALKPVAKKTKTNKSLPKTLLQKASVMPPKSDNDQTIENSEALIASIKTTKQPIAPENKKQQEQIKIIDNFIKVQPRLSAKKRSATEEFNEEPDLAARSVEFGDSIISETLAEILIQQGKIDKAIEVLKRLIWKFPQKKTYFAAQIEELKK